MKVIMTLLVRDEQDIIATNIEYHLSQGIDFIIVTDNLSCDDTPKILKKYEEKGLIKIISETSDDYSQHKWVTRMAQMAYNDYDADWVINNDADEFWLPDDPTKTLKQTLKEVPKNIVACKASRVNFLPPTTTESTHFFAETMITREYQSFNAIGQPLPPKTCHRGFSNVIVKQGNHHVEQEGIRLKPAKIPVTIMHYPLRSFSQFENKISKGGAAYERNQYLHKDIGSTWRNLYTKHLDGTLLKHYRQQIPSKDTITQAFTSGELINDTRLIEYIQKHLNYSKLSS